MAPVHAVWCLLLGMLHTVYSQNSSDTADFYSRNITSYFTNFHNLSLLQIRSRFPCDIELRPSPQYGIIVYLEVNASDKDSISQVGVAVEIPQHGDYNSLILQIDMFVEENHTFIILTPVLLFSICISICSVCLYRYKKHLRASRELLMTSQTKGIGYGSGQSVDKLSNITKDTSLRELEDDISRDPSSGSLAGTVKTRARLFEQGFGENSLTSEKQQADLDRDIEMNAPSIPRPNIKYLIAKFQENQDEVQDFAPKQHIVGIRYAITPSETPGGKDKIRKKFFMTSAARRRFVSSPLKRLHQHVQAKIQNKVNGSTQKLKVDKPASGTKFKTGRNMRIYQTMDMSKHGSRLLSQSAGNAPGDFNKNPDSTPGDEKGLNPSEEGRVKTSDKTMKDGGVSYPDEVQVSVVYLRSKILRLLAGHNTGIEGDNQDRKMSKKGGASPGSTSGHSQENEEFKELYELVSALVEPPNGGTDSLVAADDDDAYGDVKIYDVRHGTANDIRVSRLSALTEEEDEGEEPIFSEHNFMTVVDLNTPDVSDTEHPDDEDYYEPVGNCQVADNGVEMRRKTRRMSSRSTQSIRPHQEFMELYDLVTTLMKSSPPSNDGESPDDEATHDVIDEENSRQESTESRDGIYTAHRPNIKYLISTFQANTDQVKDFLPRMGHHKDQCVSNTPPPVNKPETNNGGGGKKKKNLLMSLFSVLSLLTVVHAVTVRLPHVQRMVIYIHPDIFKQTAGRIEVFVPHSHHVVVDTDQWNPWQPIPVQVYDVDELPGTEEFCLPSDTCPHVTGYTASRIACDPTHNTCICPRGYVLANDTCIDLDECLTGKHNCHAYAYCENRIGSYVCTCNQTLGVWGDGKTCQACSVDCPYEHYISKECTAYKDRECSPCKQCEEDEYEFYGCGIRVNRHCLHPAGSPAVLRDDIDDVTYKPVANKTGYVIHHGVNTMVGENLHNISDLTWIYHVSKPSLDFEERIKLVRESGIEFHLTLHEVNLLPKFEERSNEYRKSAYKISGLKHNERDVVERFTDKYCRKLVPDYYTLSLKLYRERLTSVVTIPCDGDDKDCPEEYKSHSNYTFRSLNDKCPYSDSLPGLAIPDQGTVCLNNIPLLTEIFDQRLEQSPVKRFPSESCHLSSSRCEKCLQQNAEADCPVIYRDIRNTTDRDRCCKISCYNTRDCRYALSESCRKVPGDCSQGDVALFVLSAHLDDVHSMSCHLRYARPQQLYSYSYKISYPQLDLESEPQLVSTRPLDDDDASSTSRQVTEGDYLSVSHESVFETGMEDVILRAKQINENWHHARYAFSIHRLKSPAEFFGTSPKSNIVHDRKNAEYKMVFQTGMPFAINKLIYSPTRSDHHCPEDVGDLYEKQQIYKSDGIPVRVQPHKDEQSRWFDVSPLDKPIITFNLNGNQSLIRHFFRYDGAHLINDDSLEAELDRERDRGFWLIKVKGYLSHCPGYIGFIVRDAHALLELIRYDALVHCKHPPCDPEDPCKFKVKFEIPMSDLGDERFFTLKLLDFNNTYEILLASVNRTEFPSLPSFQIPDYLFSLPDFPWTLFGGIIALGISATISLVGILIYAEKKNPHRQAKKFRKATGGKSGWVTGKNAELAKRVYIHSNKLQARHCIFIVWTLIFKIAYACVFSFTAFYFLLLVIHHDDLETIRTLPNFVRQLNERNENISRAIDHHREQEIIRQQNHTGHMQQSCDIYMQQLFKKIRREMAEITLFHRLQMFDIKATVSFNVGQLATKEMREFAWRVGNYTKLYKRKISSELRHVYEPFAEWLHRVMYNGWFQIGVGLYQVRKHFIEPIFDVICLPLPAISLLDFLGIDAALNINFLPRDLLLKIKHGLPALPTFDIPDLSDMFLNYSLPGFLPEELLHIYIPDIVLPGLDISICPQWDDQRPETDDRAEQSPGSVSGVDSQRSFVTPFDPAARAQSDSALEDYLREMTSPVFEANVSGDGRGTIWSYDEAASFHIDTADSEQEFRDRQRDVSAETEVVYTSRVWEYTRLTLFKMFGVLDVVLLLYRLSKIYVIIVQLTRGFTEIIPQTETERRIRENKKAAKEFEEKRKKLHDESTAAGGDKANTKKNRISQQDVRIYVENTFNKPNIFDRHRLDSDSEQTIKERVLCVGFFCFYALTTLYLGFINGVKSLIDKAVHTSLVPKLILIGCACIVTYVIVVIGFLYLTVQSLDELGIYDMLAARLDINLEYSNLKIWENAAFLENVTMKAYYEQMQQQLSGMVDVINAFNIEQAGIISMYENEICSYRREITGKRDCDFKILFRKLEMELLPCQLISTQPIVYEGYEREAFINETKFESEPYVEAIRNVIIHTFYAVLVVIALIALITALGYALFEYLKSRNMIRVIKIYQMDREEQTYAAIYRSVKRRQTIRRRERRQKKEEALKRRSKQTEKNADTDEGNEGCRNEVARNGVMMRKRRESTPDLDPAAVVVKDGTGSGKNEKDLGQIQNSSTL